MVARQIYGIPQQANTWYLVTPVIPFLENFFYFYHISVNINGDYIIIEKIKYEILKSPITVYNFRASNDHTYSAKFNFSNTIQNSVIIV